VGLTQHHLPEDRKPDGRLILHLAPDSERAAQFRVLRHHMLAAGRPQVIVVTSPGPGEGKTTTAVNLALALAECNRAKVLLVETHLRRPQLASVFAFVPPWCFAEQLAAHRHQPLLPWGLIDIPQLWLHVAAVNPKPEHAQLLDAPAFAIAMERLRLGGYDHIVIDAPPVQGTAEVNLLQDAADGVVMVTRARRTTRRQLRTAIEQISPRKVLGTVMLDS
jgi:Mrp family chromosome partitioning ATPase